MMFNKIKCFLLGHKFSKFAVGFQALNSEGIAYTTCCDRCGQRYSVNINTNIRPNEYENKKLLSKFVVKFGFTY